MIFSLLINHNHDRMSSITRVLRTATWDFFTSRLPDRFIRSPKIVKEVIMTDINDFVQESWRTSSDGAVKASFFAMRRLLGILQDCFNNLDVCFAVFATAVDLAEKEEFYRSQQTVIPGRIPPSRTLTTKLEPILQLFECCLRLF